jgi:pimeloyl-ACP methyl ester carboxylesterase
VDAGGLKTWFDTWGSGPPLVLLHGGLVTNTTWEPMVPLLAEQYRVLAPERRGHGHTADVEGPVTYELMTQDTIAFLDEVVGEPAPLVGWSDGGIIGLMVAMRRPDLVSKLVPISANFALSGVVPEMVEAAPLMEADAPDNDFFRSMYEAASPDGPEHWPIVFDKFKTMVQTEVPIDPEQLGTIQAPTLVIASDDDMVLLEHSIELYRSVPESQLAIVPGTSHGLVLEKPEVIGRLILDFLGTDPIPTMMPFRRAPSGDAPPK